MNGSSLLRSDNSEEVREVTSICCGALSPGKVGMKTFVSSSSAAFRVRLRESFSSLDLMLMSRVIRHMLTIVGEVR